MQNFRSLLMSQPVVRELVCRRFFQTSSILGIKAGDKIPSVDLFEGAPDKKVNTSHLVKARWLFLVYLEHLLLHVLMIMFQVF
uniref:Uncharacterized protein n=1 Tax=Arion vulgaris TaxID=1028688 RepID=A0A0B7ADI2_9EUPU